jgi:hypothetical protein
MSQLLPQFIGPSSQLEAIQAAVQRTVNWYLTPNEHPPEESKFTFAAMPCPANAPFSPLPVPAPFNQWSRGLVELRGRAFGVNGTTVFEIDSTGAYISNIGSVVADGSPVCMVPNGNGQIFICSGGLGYVIPPGAGSGSLIPITDPNFLGASYATFQDGYILTVVPNSNSNQISGNDDTPIGDATLWDAANQIVQGGQADYQRAIISSREYVRLMGYRRSQVYQNVGANGIGGFPFQSYNETFIETGIAAPFSLIDIGDSLIWIGEDVRGMRACWRDPAFQPQRISDFGVERWWQKYSSVDDAMAFAFIWMGHLFYQVTFPSALVVNGVKTSATWLYDATASALAGKPIWTERSYLANGGLQDATSIAPGRAEVTHCYAFGKHLVGSNGADGNPGAIYQYSDSFLDCGADPVTQAQIAQPLICDRITPHLWLGEKRVIHNRIEFEVARGTGNQITPGVSPALLLRWSNDGGETFGTEWSLPTGKAGQYTIRVDLNRLGYSQHPGRVYWVRCADPVMNCLMNVSSDFFVCGS